MIEAPGEPCGRCGVRADVGCKHRAAAGAQPQAIANETKKPKRPGNLNSPWGKAGNPTGADARRVLDGLKARLR